MKRKQLIRAEVLLQLYGAGMAMAITPAFMARQARLEGADYTESEMLEAALFQCGQGYAAEQTETHTGVRRFQITSAGMLQHERTGL